MAHAAYDAADPDGDGDSGTDTCVDDGPEVPVNAFPSVKVPRDGDVRDIRVMDAVAAWEQHLAVFRHRPPSAGRAWWWLLS